MRQETLVQGKETLGVNCLGETVDNALVQVSVLVVETGHDRVCKSRALVTVEKCLTGRTNQEDA